MKKLMIVTLILGASFQAATAKIWRVNNTNGVTADFTTPSAAQTAASGGDTIQIEGSLLGYGAVTCTKKLIWIGPGYFLAENPQTQYNLDSAIGTNFTFNTGSSGSMVMGMYSSTINIETNFITILRNYGSNITLGSIANVDSTFTGIVIEQNYNCNIYNYTGYSTISGLQVFSNYIGEFYMQNTTSSGTLYSNVISTLQYLNGFLVEDNIISGDTIAFASNNTFLYNILYNGTNTTPTALTNYNFYVSPFTTIFVNWNSSNALDDNLELSASSPAKGQGNGGIDLGIFGSGTPYILSGMPAVPSIYGLTGPNTVASGATTMSMTVSIKSHN